MFAAYYEQFGSPDVLSIGSFGEPHPQPEEIRIRVMAAGVSPVDGVLRAGSSPFAANVNLPHIPGVDAAGIVDAVGATVTDVAVGDEVFGSVDLRRLGGATAEFAVLSSWARKPTAMNWSQAGGAGTSVETATRALDLLHIAPGMTLLVDGATGGVGSVAVQLALARGARVIGTGDPRSADFLLELGASAAVYGAGLPGRIERLHGGRIDRALDIAGRGSLPELILLTGSPDAVVTLADPAGPEAGVQLSMGELAGEPTGWHGLDMAAMLFNENRFHIPVQKEFTLDAIGQAHAFITSGARRGKVIVTVGL